VWNPLTSQWDNFTTVMYQFGAGWNGSSISPIFSVSNISCLYFDTNRVIQFRYPILYQDVTGDASTDYTGFCESSLNVTGFVINVAESWAAAQVEEEGMDTVFFGENATNGWRIDGSYATIYALFCNQAGTVVNSNDRIDIVWIPSQMGNVELSCNMTIIPKGTTTHLTSNLKQYVRVEKGMRAWIEK
jgi:hypothetical protein